MVSDLRHSADSDRVMPHLSALRFYDGVWLMRERQKSIIRSIDETVAALPSATLQAGIDWFPKCRADIHKASILHGPPGVGPVRAAGIFAALSPRLQWQVNWDGMVSMLKAARRKQRCPEVGLHDARAKAWAIAMGEHPANILSGPKVTRFFANLSGDDDPITVDVWMARAAGLKVDVPSKWEYVEIESAVRMAAARLGVTPCGLQAAIWMHVRPPKPNDPWAVV